MADASLCAGRDRSGRKGVTIDRLFSAIEPFVLAEGLWCVPGPISGALVHNAGSVLVVSDAALLYDRRFDDGEQAAGEALSATGGR